MTGRQTPSERGLYELYVDDPERADALLHGTKPGVGRRAFMGRTAVASISAAIGMAIPFGRNMPSGFIPMAFADTKSPIPGKDGLVILNDRPLNAETPANLLNAPITPTDRHFIRNNGIPPVDMDAGKWSFVIDGLVEKPLKLSIADLKRRFEVVDLALQLECGGNGRAFFKPGASGNQWTYGAVGCSRWTGVRLRDVLKAAGVKPNAIYTAHYGADLHLSGKAGKSPISRGMPVAKALDADNLIAFAQNGKDIHPMNGAPLRIVAPGWPGSCSQKWLTRIQVRDIVHDGPKMTGTSYKVPRYPVAPGQKVPTKDYMIIEAMPVKSLITSPATGVSTKERTLAVQGHAWAGDRKAAAVYVSKDFGATWQKAELDAPVNSHAWQNWRTRVSLPQAGYYEIWARAVDEKGVSQPFAVVWNPKGYLNNAMHRIAVKIV